MPSLKTFLYIYLFGGVTFIPLLLVSAYYLYVQLQKLENKGKATTASSKDNDSLLLVSDIDPDFKAGALEDEKGVKVFKRGWITVTNQYYLHASELATSNNDDATTTTSVSSSTATAANNKVNETQLLSRAQLKKKHKFYAVLKHGNLFLYKDDEPKSNLIHAIALVGTFVTIWPRDPKQEMLDASLFTKKTCIALFKNNIAAFSPQENTLQFKAINSTPTSTPTADQFYLYFENNSDKEDWYFQLINATKMSAVPPPLSSENKPIDLTTTTMHSLLNPSISADPAHLKTRDSLYLIQTLHSTEGQLTTKWFNALIGRLFLSLQRTDSLNKALLEKIDKKLTKINKPGFLDDFVIEQVDVGTSAPFVTNPSLREISTEGLTKIAFDLQYRGNLSIIISTKVNINLGSRFKTREVSLKLSIKVKEISGPMLVLIKPPPSNRIWYAFETEPIMDLEIEPVVSSSKLNYNMITNVIKGKFAEAIKESLVVPFMDDLVFFDTGDEIFRGGIWEKHIVSTWNPDDKKIQSPSRENTKNSYDTTTSHEKKDEEIDEKDIDSESQLSGKNHSAVESLRKSLDTRDSHLKANIKKVLRHNSTRDLDGTPNSTSVSESHSITSEQETTPVTGTKSKQYIKTSFKKIGKWYSEKVNNLNEDDNNEQSNLITENDSTSQSEANTKLQTPKMISNRRRVPPKPAVPPYQPPTTDNTDITNSSQTVPKIGEPSTTTRLPSSSSTASDMVGQQHGGPNKSIDSTSITTSPVINATEMFANKEQSFDKKNPGIDPYHHTKMNFASVNTTSNFSTKIKSHPPNLSTSHTQPNLNHAEGFVKTNISSEIPQNLFDREELDDSN
ncbi:Nvj2p NDAI_0A04950 [Naumovozyma dairenensis CBS 421]|uniref:SMP-LTD domain-containing protein n=1 Tax=Naumovozyma dairenensis (strain ATCC 10597 / BCRC 20456 / CBS 421 / NBRC 0211 / NRRL Y-12639) TaxID=1071378 RepID=G0W4B2_NAUDC|nr:hypothetical protein NDAI_0A04950 [Naumovozyma dairenensis CBS 421]CCD22650.1 hypothetical protein NDAI_0A04950 [Naumovozyma dairenensis CBS 421]